MEYDRLAFGVCWYNDPGIFRLLDSLPDDATKYVVDGRFKWNESKNPLSNRNMRRRVQRYPNVTIIDAPDLLEPDKRQKYLDAMALSHHDYCFIIDSDEYVLEADWKTFYERCCMLSQSRIHYIQFKPKGSNGIALYPRLWVNPGDWSYHKCHCVFKNKTTGQTLTSGVAGKGSGTFKSILCAEDDMLRNEQWITDTKNYQKRLHEYEIPIKEKFK